MTLLPPLPEIAPWLFVARIASAPEAMPWSLMATPINSVAAIAAELAEHFGSLLKQREVEIIHSTDHRNLLTRLRAATSRAILVTGLDTFDAAAWQYLDVNRSRMERVQPAVLVLEERSVEAIIAHAPNLASWLGGSMWRVESGDESSTAGS